MPLKITPRTHTGAGRSDSHLSVLLTAQPPWSSWRSSSCSDGAGSELSGARREAALPAELSTDVTHLALSIFPKSVSTRVVRYPRNVTTTAVFDVEGERSELLIAVQEQRPRGRSRQSPIRTSAAAAAGAQTSRPTVARTAGWSAGGAQLRPGGTLLIAGGRDRLCRTTRHAERFKSKRRDTPEFTQLATTIDRWESYLYASNTSSWT